MQVATIFELKRRARLHRSSQPQSLFGYIVYPIVEAFELAHAVPVASLNVRDIMNAIQDVPGLVQLCPYMATLAVTLNIIHMHVVLVSRRMQRSRLLVPTEPTKNN